MVHNTALIVNVLPFFMYNVIILYLFSAVLQAVTDITVRRGDINGELSVTWQLLSLNVTGYTVRYDTAQKYPKFKV